MSVMNPFFIFEDTSLSKWIVDVHDWKSELSELMICCATSGPMQVFREEMRQLMFVYEIAKRTVDAVRAMVT